MAASAAAVSKEQKAADQKEPLSDLNYEDQAIFFLNVFWDACNADLKAIQRCVWEFGSIDATQGNDGTALPMKEGVTLLKRLYNFDGKRL